jgi:ATP phosphoribosyltransferase
VSRGPLRIALPKGRMMDEALRLFAALGSVIDPAVRESRRLILPSTDGRFEFLPVKNIDVPVYVEAGVADAGVVGLDVLVERGPDVLRPLDLRFGPCGLAVAAPAGAPYPHLPGGETPRVATKYVESARAFFARKGMQVELIHISGSVEIAPLLGLAHWIVDLVQTGRTLAENGLVVVEEVSASSARLIVNRASHKLRLEEHQRLIGQLAAAVEAAASANSAASSASINGGQSGDADLPASASSSRRPASAESVAGDADIRPSASAGPASGDVDARPSASAENVSGDVDDSVTAFTSSVSGDAAVGRFASAESASRDVDASRATSAESASARSSSTEHDSGDAARTDGASERASRARGRERC